MCFDFFYSVHVHVHACPVKFVYSVSLELDMAFMPLHPENRSIPTRLDVCTCIPETWG